MACSIFRSCVRGWRRPGTAVSTRSRSCLRATGCGGIRTKYSRPAACGTRQPVSIPSRATSFGAAGAGKVKLPTSGFPFEQQDRLMDRNLLSKTAAAMVAKGKGLLAADESSGTCEKRFKSVGVDSTEANRRAYRDLLFTTKGIEEFVSGVILFDETLRQSTVSGNEPFPEYLARKGIIPGIKVDKGIHDLALSPGEKVAEGLDGLRGRLEEYFRLGARFAKWRAVITIGKGIPSHACLFANAHALARYSALCQEASIVPIVEPEVLLDGSHTIEQDLGL